MTRWDHRFWLALCLAPGLASPSGAASQAPDELASRSTWQPPTAESVEQQLEQWLQALPQPPSDETLHGIRDRWQDIDRMSCEQTLANLIESVSMVDSRIADLVRLCSRPRPATEIIAIPWLDSPELPDLIRSNCRLYYGTWLANQQLYDEAHEVLAPLDCDGVINPAGLLFYQSLISYRRLEKDRCLSTLAKLLENEADLPRRYAAVAKLMAADLEPLEAESLNEISRIMDSIKVRLGHGRAGTRVRDEENKVIEKLDKLIKQLEEQASAMAYRGAGQGGQPSQPMQDSMPGQESGPGNVDPKQLGSDTDWGNLPPKQREEALQQLSKDLPSHYRTVIEEYFRKLAKDGQ